MDSDFSDKSQISRRKKPIFREALREWLFDLDLQFSKISRALQWAFYHINKV